MSKRSLIATTAGLLVFSGLTGVSCLMGQQTLDEDRVRLLEQHLAAQKRLIMDWGGLLRYGSENTEVKPPTADEKRVVFLGDQITESWGASGVFFPELPYLNRGINGQTTSQLLVRFRQDVIELQPKVVIIQGGINDIAGIHGASAKEVIAENLMSMSDLARAHGIAVVLASVLPVCDCFEKSTGRQRWPGRIIELNEAIKVYAVKNRYPYLDYYAAMDDASGRAMRKELTTDGIIPSEKGYAVMMPLAEKAIEKALEKND